MSTPSSPQRQRYTYGLAVLAVVVVLLVLGVIYLNRANGNDRNAVNPSPSTTATDAATPSGTTGPSPTVSTSGSPAAQIAFADCSSKTFGPPLAPLNPPASVHSYPAAPAQTIDANKLYKATIHTAKGDIVICLQPNLAPQTVNNFVTLARNHYYDGLIFHRVGPDASTPAVAQGGDPNCITGSEATCGQGGPGYKFNDEPVLQSYVAGTLAMANSGPNTNGSQFFIDTDVNQFPPSYSLFGKVSTGLDVAKKIVKGDAMITVTVAEQQ